MYYRDNENDMIDFKDNYIRPDTVFSFGPIKATENKWGFRVSFKRIHEAPALWFNTETREEAAGMSKELAGIFQDYADERKAQRLQRDKEDREFRLTRHKHISGTGAKHEAISN